MALGAQARTGRRAIKRRRTMLFLFMEISSVIQGKI